MYKYQFYFFPGKYLNYKDFRLFTYQIKSVPAYKTIKIDVPMREYFKDKIVVIATQNDETVAYRIAEYIKIPRSVPILFVYDIISTPLAIAKDLSYNIFYKLVQNLVFRFKIYENTYVCCINDNFFNIHRFESDFMQVFPSITKDYPDNLRYINMLEYLITNRTELFQINDPSEIDRNTYLINNQRLIQIGKTNIIKCISNIFKSKIYNQSKLLKTNSKITTA